MLLTWEFVLVSDTIRNIIQRTKHGGSRNITLICGTSKDFILFQSIKAQSERLFIMAKSPKKNRGVGSAKAAGEAKSKPKKKRTTTDTKKSRHNGTSNKGTSKAVAVLKTPKKSSPKAVARTPTKKGKKLATTPTTPSTVSSKSTTDSKRAATLMSGLALTSPSAQKKSKAEDVDEASLTDTIDYQDPNTIPWLTEQGVDDALEYHFPDREKYFDLDYHEKVLLVMQEYKLAEMKSVLQGLLTDAGKNWRKLKLNRFRSMKVFAPKFAEVCVELFNAKTKLDVSTQVPGDITIDHGKGKKKSTS